MRSHPSHTQRHNPGLEHLINSTGTATRSFPTENHSKSQAAMRHCYAVLVTIVSGYIGQNASDWLNKLKEGNFEEGSY